MQPQQPPPPEGLTWAFGEPLTEEQFAARRAQQPGLRVVSARELLPAKYQQRLAALAGGRRRSTKQEDGQAGGGAAGDPAAKQ